MRKRVPKKKVSEQGITRNSSNKTKSQSNASAKPKRNYKIIPIDTTFTIIVLMILSVGLIMMFSASSIYANYYKNDSFYFIKRQLVFAIVGVVVMFLASKVDYHFWEKFTVHLYVITIILLVLVLLIPTRDNFKRWIDLGFISLQPSEIAKLVVAFVCAKMVCKFGEKKMQTIKYGIGAFIVVLIPIVFLVAIEPHLSGTILILAIAAIIMIIGGTRFRWFAIVAAAVVPLGYIFAVKLGYAADRLALWKDPFIDKQDKGYQTVQSLFAISSGSLMGQGFGNSKQKFLYLPEPQNDFIFSIVCEEVGFLGATLIIILFALLVWRGFVIAMRARDKFGALITIGIISQVGVQALLNIAVVTNTIPNTGISLPFFSYGGTSLLMLLGQMGIILSVSRHSRIEKE